VERRNGARRKTRPEEDVQKRGIPAMLVLSGGCPVLGGSVGGSCPVSGGGTPICKTTRMRSPSPAMVLACARRLPHRRLMPAVILPHKREAHRRGSQPQRRGPGLWWRGCTIIMYIIINGIFVYIRVYAP
jgi:hypothetical protein